MRQEVNTAHKSQLSSFLKGASQGNHGLPIEPSHQNDPDYIRGHKKGLRRYHQILANFNENNQ